MARECFAQDTGDLVTVDAREAVPIYETRAREAEGGRGRRGKGTSRSVFYLSRVAKRPSRMQVGVRVYAFTYTRADACRLRRSPSALCQRVLNLTQGALLLRRVSPFLFC